VDANLIVQASKTSHINTVPKLMKDGESALVRVLSDKGGGKYEGLVSGVRVSFSSARPLTTGSSFVASVKISGNTIILVPKELENLAANKMLEGGALVQGMDLNQLAAWLGELGLPADSMSAALLQISKQMEMRLDTSLLSKVRSLALRFGAKGRVAAELAMLLAEKGLSVDEELLADLIGLLAGEDAGEPGGDKASLAKSKDLLNKANSEKGSWFVFPFELVGGALEREERALLGRGSIRMLLGKNQKIKLVNLFCAYNQSDYFFSISFDGGRCGNIKMHIDKPEVDIDASINEVKSRLKKYLPSIDVLWCEREEIEGSASASEEFYSFGGYV